MRKLTAFPNDAVDKLEHLLSEATQANEYKRIQAVYLRAKYGYSAKQIAEILGFTVQSVRNLHSRYMKEGEEALRNAFRGGRKNYYLTESEEKVFLFDFEKHIQEGQIFDVQNIHQAYNDRVGKEVYLSTIYRLLKRHGWRKSPLRPPSKTVREI